MKRTENRLYNFYITTVVPNMVKECGYKNINAVPKVEKIVINRGLGDIKDNQQAFQKAVDELAIISGQKPVILKAKKSVANFKLREGMKIGAKVTLRGLKMYDFLDKIISIALPRTRDFQGLSGKSFDGRGNYAFGFTEQLVFPEISYEKIDKIRGMDVMIITSAKTDDEAKVLLEKLGFPFKK